jgi:hypothetical protein
VIDLPPRGTAERDAMIRRIAAKVWEGRDDLSFEQAGDYWQFKFTQFVTEVVDAIEAEGSAMHP